MKLKKKNLPKILETAKKTKEWGFNFMTGEIDIFDDVDVETERETEDESERERDKTLKYLLHQTVRGW